MDYSYGIVLLSDILTFVGIDERHQAKLFFYVKPRLQPTAAHETSS